MSESKKIKKSTAIQVKNIKGDEVSGFIQQAIESKLPVETMERLFTLLKDVKAEKARESFVVALAEFQSTVPIIKKTKKVLNKDSSLRYMYAPMDSVIEQIKGPLAKNGFSYNWDSTREEKHIKVICKLTHINGHSETSTFDIPIVESQYMTSPQSYATAQSYAKRYTLLNVLGIGTADEDTDATDSVKDTDVKSQKAKIMFLLRRLEYKTESKDQITKAVQDITKLKLEENNYQEIVNRLEIIINEKQGL